MLGFGKGRKRDMILIRSPTVWVVAAQEEKKRKADLEEQRRSRVLEEAKIREELRAQREAQAAASGKR